MNMDNRLNEINLIVDIIKKYRNTIKESTKSVNDFYIENNIDPDVLSYLGRGDFGEAYSIGDGRVLKKTSSKSEYKFAQEIENKNVPALDGFADIYKTEIVDGEMYIILEELDTDSSIEDLFYELQNYLDEQGLHIQYLDNLDRDELDLSKDLELFIEDMYDIIRSYRYLGIEASDIKPDNMGYDKNRKLKAFDIDDRQK
jgi:hypothetical protein